MYTFKLGDEEHSVRNERELALVFELLAKNITGAPVVHWEVIMQLDCDLEKIIKTYHGLILAFKYLNDKNKFLLLIKIGDVLVDIITNAYQLSRILSEIPKESDKIRLIKQLRAKGLKSLINNARDIGDISEWIYGDAEKVLLNILDMDFIRMHMYEVGDVLEVIYYLEDENKDYLIFLIGLENIKKMIRRSKDFFDIIGGLSNSMTKRFLRMFTKEEIKEIIKNDRDFHMGLKRISFDKEKSLLTFLGLENVK